MKRKVDRDDVVKNRMIKQQKIADKLGRQSRDEFKCGDKVVVQDPATRRWTQEGEIGEERISDDGKPVSFLVKFNTNKTGLRHKCHIRHAVKKKEVERVQTLKFSDKITFSDGCMGSPSDKKPVRPSTRLKLKRDSKFKTRWGAISPPN